MRMKKSALTGITYLVYSRFLCSEAPLGDLSSGSNNQHRIAGMAHDSFSYASQHPPCNA